MWHNVQGKLALAGFDRNCERPEVDVAPLSPVSTWMGDPNTEVKQCWAWSVLGWETGGQYLDGRPGVSHPSADRAQHCLTSVILMCPVSEVKHYRPGSTLLNFSVVVSHPSTDQCQYCLTSYPSAAQHGLLVSRNFGSNPASSPCKIPFNQVCNMLSEISRCGPDWQ